MADDFESVRSQAIKYAMDMNQKSTNNNNANPHKLHNSRINNIFNTGIRSCNRGNGDISLILALIMLLSQDGADMPLMLALIYIMT